jgi:hypothetical protein
VSITLPIFILALLYPHLRGQRLLTRRRFEIVLVILFLDVLACTTLLNQYVPFWPMYLIAIAAVFGLVFYAEHLPKGFLMPERVHPTWSPRRFAVLGFAFLLLSFLASAIFAESTVPFLIPIVMEFVIACWVLVMIWEHMGTAYNLAQKAYFAVGMLCFFIFLGTILVFGGWLDMLIPVVGTALFAIDFTRWSRGKRVLFFRVGRIIYGDSRPKASGAELAAK